MTLRVYTVSRDGTVTDERPEVRVMASRLPLPTPWIAYPPCMCPRCRDGRPPRRT